MKTGAGAALLATPDLAVACLRAVVEEVGDEVPVTVKIRAGVRAGDQAGSLLAPRLVAAGAAAICIHPRYASQLYKGPADHAVTLALARELPVPVIASGDIGAVGPDGCPDRAAVARLLDGGVAAVMVARAALGRPWVFAELLEGGGAPPLDERRRALALFVDGARADLGARAVGYLRRFWPRFRRSGVLDAAQVAGLMAATDLATIARLVRPDRRLKRAPTAAGGIAGRESPIIALLVRARRSRPVCRQERKPSCRNERSSSLPGGTGA